jgi:uncharacterized membrane protein
MGDGAAETRLMLNRWLALLLGGCWLAAMVATFLLDATLGKRFLDLPLSALIAGQGALFAVVLVGVRAAAPGDGEEL